jgi:hypothetical protein
MNMPPTASRSAPVHAQRAQPLGARALEELQVVCIEDDAAGIGVFPIDAYRPGKDAAGRRSCSSQDGLQARRRFLQLRHRVGGGKADEAAGVGGMPKSRPGVTATWARFMISKAKSQLPEMPSLRARRCNRPRRRRRRPAPPAREAQAVAAAGMNQSRRALNSARRRSYSAGSRLEAGQRRMLRHRAGADEQVLREPLDHGHQRLGHHHPAQAPAGHVEVLGEAVDADDVVVRSPARCGRRCRRRRPR